MPKPTRVPKDSQRFRAKLMEFIQASTLQAAGKILDETPELLSDLAEQHLEMLIKTVRKNKDLRSEETLVSSRTLLKRCRRVDVEQAIAEAIRARSPSLSRRSVDLVTEAVELGRRYKETGKLRDVDRALDRWNKLLLDDRTQARHPGLRGMILNDSAVAYLERFNQTREAADASAAIERLSTLESETQADAPAIATVYDNLALAYLARASVGHAREDVDRAVEWAERGVAAEPADSPRLVGCETHLAEALMERSSRSDSKDDLSRAIDIYQSIVDRMTAGALPEDEEYRRSLAASLKKRYDLGKDAEDLKRVHDIVRRAMRRDDSSAKEADSRDEEELDDLAPLVTRFVNADSWAESRRLCEEHPQLLSEEADAFLEAWVQCARQEKATDMADSVAEHRRLLAVARQVGVAAAFAEKSDWGPGEVTPEVSALLEELEEATGDDADRQVALASRVLDQIGKDTHSRLWASMHATIAMTLLGRDPRQPRDIEESIRQCETAMQVFTPAEYPEEWAKTQLILSQCYAAGGSDNHLRDLRRARHYAESALKVLPASESPSLRVKALTALADAYRGEAPGRRSRFDKRELAVLEEAGRLVSRELSPFEWASVQRRLAAFHLTHHDGDPGRSSERAFAITRRILEDDRIGDCPEDKAASLKLLGTALIHRAGGVHSQNVEDAIEYLEEAREIFEVLGDREQQGGCLTEAASAYLDRVRGETVDNVDHAIRLLLEAERLFESPENLVLVWNNLSSAYHRRHRGNRQENLETALQYCENVLQHSDRSSAPADWAAAKLNEGVYCMALGGERGERAIQSLKEALQVFSRERFPHEWSIAHNNLGKAYHSRLKGSSGGNIKKAIQHLSNALQVQTRARNPYLWAQVEDNIADCLAEKCKSAQDVAEAALHYRRALEVYTLEQFPAERLEAITALGDLYFERKDWTRAHATYLQAIETGERLLVGSYTETGRTEQFAQLHRPVLQDAYCLVRIGKPGEALVRLQQGQARRLNEALILSEAPLGLPARLRRAFEKQVQVLRSFEAKARDEAESGKLIDQDLSEQLRAAREVLARLTEGIRAKHSSFMAAGLGLGQLLELIPSGGALISPVPSDHGTAVIVVPHGTRRVGKQHVVMLDGLSEGDIGAIIFGPDREHIAEGWVMHAMLHETEPDSWDKKIEDTGERLWKDLLGPVYERLQWLGVATGARVLFQPTSGLGLLPVHAAWRAVDGVKRSFLDEYTVVYAPSGLSLSIGARGFANRGAAAKTLLAVVNPTGDLEFAAYEAQGVEKCFPASCAKVLSGSRAVAAALVQSAPGRAYLHFCCHGKHDWTNPLESYLLLAKDTRLTLKDILARLRLKARLVVLSACETGVTDLRNDPDEHLGLATGFLQAGALAVISTLWAVADCSTMLLIERFYQLHLKQRSDPALALREAQLWLRDVTVSELEKRFSASKSPRSARDRALKEELSGRNGSERPFEHPYYWGPFFISGV